MAQATFVRDSGTIPYTPGSAVTAGDVEIVGNNAYVAKLDIAASALGTLHKDGDFDFVKATGAFSADDDVYWDTDGDPVGGTAGTGAATSTAAGNYFLGVATDAAVSGGATVRVRLHPAIPDRIPGLLTLSVGASTAAAGSAVGDAAALPSGTASIYPTSAGDGIKGVIISATDKVTGRTFLVTNGAAAVVKIYPPTGGAINNGSVNAAFSTASGGGALITCIDSAANTWSAITV
jgi:predicted RecA/RadA family phage recombinase